MELCSETCDFDLRLQIDFYSGLISHELKSSYILHLFSFIHHHAELVLIHGLPAAGVAEGADANLGLGR